MDADVVHRLRAALMARGFDRTQPFGTGRFNGLMAAKGQPQYRLPDFERADAAAILVGNSRSMWPHFQSGRRSEPDPLDRWVERTIAEEAGTLGCRVALRFPPDPPPNRLPFQRLAAAIGFAWLSPAWLLIDPVLGPWVSLRAVIVLDRDASACQIAPAPVAKPCADCATRCEPAFRAALHAPSPERWLAVRDACPLGREYRFTPEQIAFHYGLSAESQAQRDRLSGPRG